MGGEQDKQGPTVNRECEVISAVQPGSSRRTILKDLRRFSEAAPRLRPLRPAAFLGAFPRRRQSVPARELASPAFFDYLPASSIRSLLARRSMETSGTVAGEVGWYVLGPNQETVGPYALVELQGDLFPPPLSNLERFAFRAAPCLMSGLGFSPRGGIVLAPVLLFATMNLASPLFELSFSDE
jgi:hypothetical protein